MPLFASDTVITEEILFRKYNLFSFGLRKLHQCPFPSYIGVLSHPQPWLFLKSFFVFGNISKDVPLLLVTFSFKRYNKSTIIQSQRKQWSTYYAPGIVLSVGIKLILALWTHTLLLLLFATEAWLCYSLISRVNLTYFTTNILCNVLLLWTAIITMFFSCTFFHPSVSTQR